MVFSWSLLILLGVALILSAIGFYKFVYFLSVGYGLSIFGIGVAIIVMMFVEVDYIMFDLFSLILAILLVLYGGRLAGFLLYREIKNATYKSSQTYKENLGTEKKKVPFGVQIAIWISVSLLYVAQTSPVYFVANSAEPFNGYFFYPGASIALIGLILETVADIQKALAKKKNPNTFVSTGVYKYVRCPNYLGEIIFWTGILVSGVSGLLVGNILNVILKWVIALLGWVLIVYVMISGAKRLEIRQNKNYGDLQEYQEYVKKTPILMRTIPLKTLTNITWIK